MNKKISLLFLSSLIILSGCTKEQSESQKLSNDSGFSSQSEVVSNTETTITSLTSEETSISDEETTSLAPLSDPDISGLTRSSLWPSVALNEYLTYSANIEMPMLESETDFHHGLVELEFGYFYQIITRVRTKDNVNSYIDILTTNYDFKYISEEMPDFHYIQSDYDDVRIHLSYKYVNTRHEVTFEFFDGDGDKYTGLNAVDNLATFDLRTKEALTSVSPTRGRWEVRPATFSVYQRTSGYAVGNTNNEHISNPLRFYPGQEAIFRVSDKYYITEIIILAASGYASETVTNGTLSNGTIIDDGDWLTLTPEGKPNEISYKLAQVMYVGQVRWLEIRLSFATK
jgi:hypothetical protein